MVVQESTIYREGECPLKNEKKHRLKQRFDVIKKLGQGTYGKVQLAINKETGQEVAIKTIKKVKIESEQDLIRIRREIQIMSSIQHPHIIHIYEVFENKDKIVLVMQYASGGELYDYLSEKKVLSNTDARRLFRQVAAAVYYCHKNKICHRDLKLENILLDDKGNAKIADFGLSNVYDERHLLNTFCGSPLYASPEIVKGVPYYGPEVDCWSMGVLLYTLVYGAMPFDGSDFKRLVKQISEGDYYEPKKKSEASGLIRHLLTVHPAKRATIVDICVDPWVNETYDNTLLQVAEDMANLTPVRIDLLLALAPTSPVPPTEDKIDEHPLATAVLDNEGKDIFDGQDDEEEEEEEEVNNPETASNSFAYIDGKNLNLQGTEEDQQYDDEDDENEFIPADLAASLEGQCVKRLAERSFDGGLMRISSLAHKNKKPRKSDSISTKSTKPEFVQSQNDEKNLKSTDSNLNEKTCSDALNKSSKHLNEQSEVDVNKNDDNNNKSDTNSETPVIQKGSTSEVEESNEQLINNKENDARKDSQSEDTSYQNLEDNNEIELQRKSSLTKTKELLEEKIGEGKKSNALLGRRPGKITIPKSFEPSSNKQTSSPEENNTNKVLTSKQVESCKSFDDPKEISNEISDDATKEAAASVSLSKEKLNTSEDNEFPEEKKTAAKGILKKGIAKAKLLEKRFSQQSSVDSEKGSITPPTTVGETSPTSTINSPEFSGPSFFKTPKPYLKEQPNKVQSQAEIVLSRKLNKDTSGRQSLSIPEESESIWDQSSSLCSPPLRDSAKHFFSKHVDWNTLSSKLDSEMSNWRQQMEDSLRKLSPEEDDDDDENYKVESRKKDDDSRPHGPAPITRSYKKFTFTKDGSCITETKKIYTTPRADGSWTRVEKKTKITTRPGNNENFDTMQRHFKCESPPLVRSDSQSSSGSNENFEDIFDSWTGDSGFCNSKMKDVINKFAHDSFLKRERRRNRIPFRKFSRADSDKKDGDCSRVEYSRGCSTDKESSDNDEDFDLHYDDSHPVVYGSQGLWQLLRSSSKGFGGHMRSLRDPFRTASHLRSSSQDRADSSMEHRRNNSRNSSGYGTGCSFSKERTQSPKETVLRFVIGSPVNQDSEPFASNRGAKGCFSDGVKTKSRRDSGLGSDGYDSEYSSNTMPGRPSKSAAHHSVGSIHPSAYQCVKSWSKELSSPPSTPPSPASRQASQEENFPQSQSDNLAESRKHRVEQWLHMTDVGNLDSSTERENTERLFSCNESSNTVPNPKSSIYGTVRPRGFMRYNRTTSEKLRNSNDDYTPLTENQRAHSLQGIEANETMYFNKADQRNVSANKSGSQEQVHHYSINAEPSSPVHQINFSISDGRRPSTQFQSQGPATCGHSFSGNVNVSGSNLNRDGSGNFVLEQKIPSRSQGGPVLQMRVSFNRSSSRSSTGSGRCESPVFLVSSQPSQEPPGSLWQHKEHATASNTVPLQKDYDEFGNESPHSTFKGFRVITSQSPSSSTVFAESPVEKAYREWQQQYRIPSESNEFDSNTQDQSSQSRED